MNFDEKTCAIAPDDSKCAKIETDTILANLRYLTECLHSIESRVNNMANVMFFDIIKERKYTEPKDMNTEIIHDREIALAILDALFLLASGIGIDQ